MRFPVSPGASGVIVDQRTHAPLRSAEVAVSYACSTLTNMPTTSEGWNEIYQMPTADREKYFRVHTVTPSLSDALVDVRFPILFTGADGRFSIPPQTVWGLYIMPMDIFPRRGTLIVMKDGYEPLMLGVSTWGRNTTNFDRISLKPK